MHFYAWKHLRCSRTQNPQIRNPYFSRIALLVVLSTGLWYFTVESPYTSPFQHTSYNSGDLNSNLSLLPESLEHSSANSTYVIVIHSAVANHLRRQVIRNTWGQGQPVFFMLGHSLEVKVQDRQDIIQGDFIDTYRNLTYKHLMGLQWAITNYPEVDYVIKVDDDVFVNVPRLKSYLNWLQGDQYRNGSIFCDVVRDGVVKRSFRSKWRLGYLEFRPAKFPTYCNGWAIIYRRPIIAKMLESVGKVPFMWVDDVYVTGLLSEQVNTGANQIDPQLLTLDWDPQLTHDKVKLKRFHQSVLGPPQLNIRQMRFLWRVVNT